MSFLGKSIQERIHSVSEFFFFFIGFLYSIGFLLKENDILVVEFEYFVNLSDTAFLFTALIYFFLSMLLKSEEEFIKNKIDDEEVKDFFWQESLFLFIGVVFFSIYFVIDVFE